MSGAITESDAGTVDLAVYTVGRLSHSELRQVDLVPSADNRVWEVVLSDSLVVMLGDEQHVVGAGFRFDGASIRYRWVNALIPRYGREILIAAAVHDWYYSDGRHLIPAGVGDRRLWCDQLFYRMLRAAGVNLVRARSAYRAVRLFGGRVWGKGETFGFDSPGVTKVTLARVGVADYAAA